MKNKLFFLVNCEDFVKFSTVYFIRKYPNFMTF